MTLRSGFTLTSVFLAILPVAVTSPGATRFDPTAYPSTSFRVSRRDDRQGRISVRVIQVKRVDDAAEKTPSYCRAWLEVWRGNRLQTQFYFDDIQPVGGSYGIFIPQRQPFTNNFIAVKEGDYDGRLLLVNTDGRAADLPGGPYFVTPDKRYLVGLHSRDSSALVIIDVAKQQVVLDGDKERLPEINSWYLDSIGYFFTEVDPKDNERELKESVYRLDLEHLRIAKVRMPPASMATARTIGYDFDPRGMTDCTSTQD